MVAQLVDRLRDAGAANIAFDIDFAEPDRTAPKLLLPLLSGNGVGAEETERLLAALPDPDRRPAESMAKVPVVTGFILSDHGETRPPLAKAGLPLPGTTRSAMSTAFRRRLSICRNSKPRPPAMAFSINRSIGTMWCAAYHC
jgi:CHASE2 domain-containing sensor protein